MASSYATARHYAHQNHLVALAMFEWHSFARQQKAMRQHLRHAVKHYDGRKLQGQVFQHWKRWCNLEGRANVRLHNGSVHCLCLYLTMPMQILLFELQILSCHLDQAA